MPMAGMPMMGSVGVERTGVPGRYAATGEFSMAGTWRLKLEWDSPDGTGHGHFPRNGPIALPRVGKSMALRAIPD